MTQPETTSRRLEKVASAAQRMAVSVAQVYREAKAGRLTIIKLGSRASALDAAQVDAWIAGRIEEAQRRTQSGGA
jgi:predicted DNA-binding transcriptional regulator AlpA